MKNLVIYHDHCTDGFAAAFSAWLTFGDENTEYLPLSYGQADTVSALCNAPKSPIDENTEIYILDFSMPKEVMEFLFKNAKKVVWLDHHKTAFEMYDLPVGQFEEIVDNRHVELDNYRSGAMISWEYFRPNEEVPMFIKHIDDRDRWQFKIPGSKEFHAAIGSIKPWTFEQWFTSLIRANYEDIYLEGSAILRAQDTMVKSAAKKAQRCVIPVYDNLTPDSHIPAAGLALNSTVFMSEIGHELANASETYGLIYYIGANKKAKVSLRSNGEYDVSAIAKSFGGGGHRNAAGFEIDLDTLMGWLK